MKNVSLVSVPLRGYGFEMAISTAEDEGDRDVSVPLRGYGFEISVFG